MNTLQKTGIALIGLWVATGGALAFADNATVQKVASNIPMMQNAFGGRHMGQGPIAQFLKTDLTDADKTNIQTIEKTYHDGLKELFKDMRPGSNSGTTDSGALATAKTKAQALKDTYINSMLPYIATDKQDAFKQFMANEQFGMGRGGREWDKEWHEGKERNGIGGGMFNQAIEKKLSTLSTNEAKLAWLNGVNAKIDALSAKVTSQNTKDMLSRVKSEIDQKIDELNGNAVTPDVFSNLLQ